MCETKLLTFQQLYVTSQRAEIVSIKVIWVQKCEKHDQYLHNALKKSLSFRALKVSLCFSTATVQRQNCPKMCTTIPIHHILVLSRTRGILSSLQASLLSPRINAFSFGRGETTHHANKFLLCIPCPYVASACGGNTRAAGTQIVWLLLSIKSKDCVLNTIVSTTSGKNKRGWNKVGKDKWRREGSELMSGRGNERN